jgi:hypothetical protein
MAKRGMGKVGKGIKDEVDSELAKAEAMVLLRTRTNLAALRPQITDKEAFDKLLRAVNASTGKHNATAELQARVSALGNGVYAVAKKALNLLA